MSEIRCLSKGKKLRVDSSGAGTTTVRAEIFTIGLILRKRGVSGVFETVCETCVPVGTWRASRAKWPPEDSYVGIMAILIPWMCEVMSRQEWAIGTNRKTA